jgi:uncharacterized protein (TIGR02147 family)
MNTSAIRSKLQSEYEERCKRNNRYSLRSYSKSLRVPLTSLQGILNGTRPLTPRTAERLSLALGIYGQTEVAPDFKQLTIDSFAMISDWYHYAILELIKTDAFKPDMQWIAKRLKISSSEVRIAVERMQRLGFLEIDGKKWSETEASMNLTNISGVVTTEASRKYQKQSLEKSIKAVDEVQVGKRDHTSMVMAIDPKDLNEAREMIKEFRRRFCKKMESTKNPKEVYQIQVSLFPLTEEDV